MNIQKDKRPQITKKQLARLIDHTLLKPDATHNDIKSLCNEAKKYGFASVFINPCYIKLAKNELAGYGVDIGTVVGFPLGCNCPSIKAKEAAASTKAGATELDVVINVGLLKSGFYEVVKDDLSGIVRKARRINPRVVIKVILETCLLNYNEKVAACRLAQSAGVDYVKTSTGYGTGGATLDDVILLSQTVKPYGLKVKASGGIRNLSQATALIEAGADRLGTSSGVTIINELP